MKYTESTREYKKTFAEGMDVFSCVCCVGGGLCDELIARAEMSYPVCVFNYVCSKNLKLVVGPRKLERVFLKYSRHFP
jgi:hypothetical protein